MTTAHTPPALTGHLNRLLDAELSFPPRLGYVALLLAALTMTSVIGALWLTEPMLPMRTQAAFAVMVVMGLTWVAFALRALTTRRILFARQRIVAARIGVTFTTVFVLGFLVLGYVTGEAAPYAAATMGLVMLAAASALLIDAHRRFARLTVRRDALMRELGDYRADTKR